MPTKKTSSTHILNSSGLMGAIVLLLMAALQLYSAIDLAVAAGNPWHTGVTEGGVSALIQAGFGLAFLIWRAVKPSSPQLRIGAPK